jgi:hypothetical protein
MQRSEHRARKEQTKMKAKTNILILFTMALVAELPALSGSFSYQDDFATDKALMDAWRHSGFVETIPPIHLSGILHYEPGAVGRGLGFYSGFDRGWDAYLAYAAAPSGTITMSGSVSFTLQGLGRMTVYSSEDGSFWQALGGGSSSAPWPSLVTVSLPSYTPAQFIELRGEGVIDNLEISVSYVPEPGSWSLIAAACLLFTMNRAFGGLRARSIDPHLPRLR